MKSALLLVVVTLCAGCQFEGYTPKEPARPMAEFVQDVQTLPLDKQLAEELDCPTGQCQIRYRVDVGQPGRLQIDVTPTGSSYDEVHTLRVVLEDTGGRVLDQRRLSSEPPLRVGAPVHAGRHYLLVQSIGGSTPFTVIARMRTGDAPVPAAQVQQPAAARQLEAVGSAGSSDAAFDPDIQFKLYRTYAFTDTPEERLESPPGTALGNPFRDRQIQRAIRYELDRKGFKEVASEDADFLVSLYVGSRSQTWYSVRGINHFDPYDFYFDQWRGRGGTIRAHSYTDGTLVIDVVNPETGELAWHGWATEAIDPSRTDREIIQSAVTRVLASFPPH